MLDLPLQCLVNIVEVLFDEEKKWESVLKSGGRDSESVEDASDYLQLVREAIFKIRQDYNTRDGSKADPTPFDEMFPNWTKPVRILEKLHISHWTIIARLIHNEKKKYEKITNAGDSSEDAVEYYMLLCHADIEVKTKYKHARNGSGDIIPYAELFAD